jgi:acyl-coenzyme A synthetase/AMP-(fatty) acid ligase
MYGQTECTRATYLPPAEIDSRPGSVGIAIPGSRAWVVDSQGHHAPPGATGELVIRGPNVMQGYWQNPLASARAVRPDRDTGQPVLFTGDLFYADEDGFLYFVSRRDDIIKTRGEKVAPREVETALHAIPGVAEAVVLGVPDAVLGQAIKAIVVRSDPALTEQQVLRACARTLEDFMVPKSVEFRTSLPKTESGKVSRRLVRQSLEPVV